jgi:hypothetical protein
MAFAFALQLRLVFVYAKRLCDIGFIHRVFDQGAKWPAQREQINAQQQESDSHFRKTNHVKNNDKNDEKQVGLSKSAILRKIFPKRGTPLLIQPLRAGAGVLLAADVQHLNLLAVREMPVDSRASSKQNNNQKPNNRFAFEQSKQEFEWRLHGLSFVSSESRALPRSQSLHAEAPPCIAAHPTMQGRVEGIAMAVWPTEHDKNVAQASCLQAGSPR